MGVTNTGLQSALVILPIQFNECRSMDVALPHKKCKPSAEPVLYAGPYPVLYTAPEQGFGAQLVTATPPALAAARWSRALDWRRLRESRAPAPGPQQPRQQW